jgi:hypothetical protein
MNIDSFGNLETQPALKYIVEECGKLSKYEARRVAKYLSVLKATEKNLFPIIKDSSYLCKLVYEDFYFRKLENVKYTEVLYNSLKDFTKRVFYELNKESSMNDVVRLNKSSSRRQKMIDAGWTEIAQGVYTCNPLPPNPKNIARMDKEFEEWKKQKEN